MNQNEDQTQRLENFPISIFSIVMGLAGLTIAWEKIQHVSQTQLHITYGLTTFTTIVFGVLFLLYLAKSVKHRQAVLNELNHPVKLNFFPAISISLLLLSIVYLPLSIKASEVLWIIGSSLHLVFTLYVVDVWIHHDKFQIDHINPAWFIPAVGNVIVPITGTQLGYTDISWFYFSIGMFFWSILLTIIFYRMLFHNPIDEKLLPTLFILIAPPAVGFVAYTRLHIELDSIAHILYGIGLFLTLLLFTQIKYFIKLRFFLSWWAYSFPIAAITIASLVMYELSTNTLYLWIGKVLLAVLTALVLLLLFKTGQAVAKKAICQAEH